MASLPTRAQVLETLFQQWTPCLQNGDDSRGQKPLGRVLVHDQFSQVSIPVVRASAMDGVAVSSARFQSGPPDTSNWKPGVDFCQADTGDDFDDRFDAVIPIEQAELSPEGRLMLRWEGPLEPGQNIRPRGSTIRAGELLARKDRQLRPFDLACLAMGGISPR